MITDEDFQKIIDWANEKGIKNRGIEKENLAKKTIIWRKGILRKKENLLATEYFEFNFWGMWNIYIPDEFFKLPNLKGLSLSLNSYNKIDKKNLQKIKFLKIDVFDASKKEIENFINSLYDLKELEYLSISSADLEKIPEVIFTLSNLKYLKLDFWDKLIGLSSDIKKLNKLEVLSLKYSSLKELPKEIGNLINLKELDFRGRGLKKLPDELSNLINLEVLNGEPYIRINNESKKMHNLHDNLTNKHFFTNYTLGNLSFPYKNLLLKGVPGTGKSQTIENILRNDLKLNKKSGNVCRINIHSASSNTDLMQGIGIESNDGKIEYKEKQGLIFNHIKKALFAPNQPFVLVLEEIQENSLNELIGDLIYLIEDNKRATVDTSKFEDGKEYDYQEFIEEVLKDKQNSHYIEIPYLIDTLTVYRKMVLPSNLYIFCTSNYRDDKKVIEDNLLRRFDVVEIYPQTQEQLGKDIFKSKDISDFLVHLNKEILNKFKDELHPDRYLVGHANWLEITEEESDKNKKLFYTALLKVLIEFKEIREVDFDAYTKDIIKEVCTNENLSNRIKNYIEICNFKYESYKEMIEKLQKKIYHFLK